MKKIFLLITVCAFSCLLNAQETATIDFTFNHLALSVKDVNRSADFYKTVLLLTEITNRTKKEGIRWFSLGGGKELHLISLVKEPVTINKAVHLALTTPHFEAFIKRLEDLKIVYSDFDGTPNTINKRADSIQQIYLQDPDDYWIEVNNTGGSVEQIKNEVWQMEESYWKYVKANDLSAYRTLWNEQFIGYLPNKKIAGKDHVTDRIVDMYKNKNMNYNYELTRKVENVFDNIVIALYDVTQIWTNEKNEATEKNTINITHIWRKTDNGWQIIGDMGANK